MSELRHPDHPGAESPSYGPAELTPQHLRETDGVVDRAAVPVPDAELAATREHPGPKEER